MSVLVWVAYEAASVIFLAQLAIEFQPSHFFSSSGAVMPPLNQRSGIITLWPVFFPNHAAHHE
jgi:hypothetical protein